MFSPLKSVSKSCHCGTAAREQKPATKSFLALAFRHSRRFMPFFKIRRRRKKLKKTSKMAKISHNTTFQEPNLFENLYIKSFSELRGKKWCSLLGRSVVSGPSVKKVISLGLQRFSWRPLVNLSSIFVYRLRLRTKIDDELTSGRQENPCSPHL